MSLLIGGAQLAGCLRGQASSPLVWNASIIKNAVNEESMRTTRPNWCAILSCVDKSRDAQCLGTCTPSRSRKSPQQCNLGGEFFAKSLEVVTESKQPVQLYPKIRWNWVPIVVNIKLTFGLSVVKMKGRRHRFRIAELRPQSLEIS